MLTLLGAVEPCENPEKPGTGGVHIVTYNFRGLVFPSMMFIHRAWVKTPLVCGEGLKVTKLIQIHVQPRPFSAQQRHDGRHPWMVGDGAGGGVGGRSFSRTDLQSPRGACTHPHFLAFIYSLLIYLS